MVDGGRDVVVWYSSGNRIANNRISGGRYGTHLMYSHRNQIDGNHYDGDVVGVFVMYSHDVALDHNVIAEASGAAGMGIGLKDSGNISLTDNTFAPRPHRPVPGPGAAPAGSHTHRRAQPVRAVRRGDPVPRQRPPQRDPRQ